MPKIRSVLLTAALTLLPLPAAAEPVPNADPLTEAAVVDGWGKPFAADEFGYTGAPDPTRWSVYNSPGHHGRGLRRPSQWKVNGDYARVTGTSDGTTGGMSFKPDRGSLYGRWEVRMRVPSRDPQYHPVLIVWPDAGRTADTNYQEIDFSEASAPNVNKFFLHYSRSQSTVVKTVDQTQWHTYAVQWTPDAVTGYLDGQVWFRDSEPSHIPRKPGHLTAQLDWFPKSGNTKTSTMDLDWVRVYTLDSTSPTPAPSPSPIPGCGV